MQINIWEDGFNISWEANDEQAKVLKAMIQEQINYWTEDED